MKKYLKRIVTIAISLAMMCTALPVATFATDNNGTEVPPPNAEWYNYLNSPYNNGVVDRPAPTVPIETSAKWKMKIGSGWGNSPTPPIIANGYIYTATNKTVSKIDKETGKVVKQNQCLVSDVGYALNSMLYADGKLFCALSGGIIQAIDPETLELIWRTPKIGGQTNCPLSYTSIDGKGYIYTGTFEGEDKNGSYICAETSKDGVVNGVKQLEWLFTPTKSDDVALKKVIGDTPIVHDRTINELDEAYQKRGFYWAGAYACPEYIAVGSDDGSAEGSYVNTARFYTLNPKTGKVISQIDNIKGDIRTSVCYDNGNLYFSTKGGDLHKVKVNANGELGEDKIVNLGGMTTATPTVYKDKAYIGVAGKGGQFDSDGGHSFAVVDTKNMKLLYKVPVNGYPQAAATLSTARENEDFDGDGKPDGRVYIYFTFNSPPGGIYCMYDIPESKTQVGKCKQVYVPQNVDMEQYGLSTVVIDKSGTMYFKNDTGYLMAVNVNYAYAKDVKVTTDGQGEVGWSSARSSFDPQKDGYQLQLPDGTTKATFDVTLPDGATADVNGVNVVDGKATIDITKDKTDVVLKVKCKGSVRDYHFLLSSKQSGANLGNLYCSNSNTPGSAKYDMAPEFKMNINDYIVDLRNASDFTNKSLVRVYTELAGDSTNAKTLVTALENCRGDKYDYSATDIKPADTRKNLKRYNVYLNDLSKNAKVQVKIISENRATTNVYTIELKRENDINIDSITLTDLKLEKGEKKTIKAKIEPENATNKELTWTSGDEKIAKVDEKTGEVTGVAKGETTITAMAKDDGKKVGTCKVTVTEEQSEVPSNSGTWKIVDGKYKYIYDNGEFAKDGFQDINGNRYYFNKDGFMVTGWQYEKGTWYYFNKKGEGTEGAMVKNSWKKIDGKWYYFYKDGKMAKNTMIGSSYVNNSGVWVKDKWVKSGNRYWLSLAQGGYPKNEYKTINGNDYYFDNGGFMKTGWHYEKGTWYYFNQKGEGTEGAMVKAAWKKISGKWYYFYEDGKMAKNTKIGSSYVNNSGVWVTDKWVKSGNRYWYSLAQGGYPKNEYKTINGNDYYFDNGGWMKTGWLYQSGTWYYFNQKGEGTEGVMVKAAWKKISGKWYYFYGNGKMAKNTKIGSSYVNNSGVWVTDKWVKSGNRYWYSLAQGGYPKNSFKNINRNTYYFDNGGWMKTGWHSEKGTWYYFNKKGEGTEGAMIKNSWKKIGGKWYYFYNNGKMAKNTTINGWRLNSSGAWVK